MRRLAAAGLLRVDEQRATAMIHAAGTGAVLTLLDAPVDQRDLGLTDALFDALCRAILTDSPPPQSDDLISIAVALATAVPDLPGLTSAERNLMSEWLRRSIAEMH